MNTVNDCAPKKTPMLNLVSWSLKHNAPLCVIYVKSGINRGWCLANYARLQREILPLGAISEKVAKNLIEKLGYKKKRRTSIWGGSVIFRKDLPIVRKKVPGLVKTFYMQEK